jgi:hypothetical protein
MKRFVRIRSWHLIAGISRANRVMTLCGRMAAIGADEADTFGDDRSCESCLRVAAKRGIA